MYDVKPITSPKKLDCGATCVQMFLAYYDVEVELAQLIEECHTRVIGTSAADIMRVCDAHGLEMHTYQMDPEEVINQDRPSIVWWKYNHWCICCGMDEDGRVIICNPDRGRFAISKSLFKSLYAGVALFNGEPPEMDI